MKIFKGFLILSIIFINLFSFSACVHVHNYDKKIVAEEYLKSESTLFEKSKYYKSCSCGQKGEDTFLYGEKLLGNLLAPTNTWYKSSIAKSKIKSIEIVNNYTETGNETQKWDASATKDNSILCYITGTKLTIYSKEQLFANPNSDVIFSGSSNNEFFSSLESIAGLDKIDTRFVVSFNFAFDRCSKLTGQLDLSSWDMSNVEYSAGMFQQCGQLANSPLDIILNSSLKYYDDFMFNHLSSYQHRTFVIPETVERIGYMHMWYNFGTKVEKVDGLENGEYYKDESIAVKNPLFSEFIVEEGNAYFKAVDGILYSKDGTRLISVPCGKIFVDKTMEILEGVTWINELSFNRTFNIEKLVLPNSYVIERYVDNESHLGKTINKGNSLSIALYRYTSVKEYIVKQDNPIYKSVNGCIYSKDGKELIAVPLHYKGVLNIENGTEIIGQEALWVDEEITGQNIKYAVDYAEEVDQINIPDSVKVIEENQLKVFNYLLSIRPGIINISQDNIFYEIVDNIIMQK